MAAVDEEALKEKIKGMVMCWTDGVVDKDILKKVRRARQLGKGGMTKEQREEFKAAIAGMDLPEGCKPEVLFKTVKGIIQSRMAESQFADGPQPDEGMQKLVKANVEKWIKENNWSLETHEDEVPVVIRAFAFTCASLIFKVRLENGLIPVEHFDGWDQ